METKYLLGIIIDATMTNLLGLGYTDEASSTTLVPGDTAILRKDTKYMGSGSRSRAANRIIVQMLIDPKELDMASEDFRSKLLGQFLQDGVRIRGAQEMPNSHAGTGVRGYYVQASAHIDFSSQQIVALRTFLSAVRTQHGIAGSTATLTLTIPTRTGETKSLSLTPGQGPLAGITSWSDGTTGVLLERALVQWGQGTDGSPGYLDVPGFGHYEVNHDTSPKTLIWVPDTSNLRSRQDALDALYTGMSTGVLTTTTAINEFLDMQGRIMARVGIEGEETMITIASIIDGTVAIDSLTFLSQENRQYEVWLSSGATNLDTQVLTASTFEGSQGLWQQYHTLISAIMDRSQGTMVARHTQWTANLGNRLQHIEAIGTAYEISMLPGGSDLANGGRTSIRLRPRANPILGDVVIYYEANPISVGVMVRNDPRIPVDLRGYHHFSVADHLSSSPGDQLSTIMTGIGLDGRDGLQSFLIKLFIATQGLTESSPATSGAPRCFFLEDLQRLVAGNVDFSVPGLSDGQTQERRAVNFLLVSSSNVGDIFTIAYQILRSGSAAINLVAVVNAQTGHVSIYEGSVPGAESTESGYGMTPNTMLRGIVARSRLISECSNDDYFLRAVSTPAGDVQFTPSGGTMFRLDLVDANTDTSLQTYQFEVSGTYGKITWSWVDGNGVVHEIDTKSRGEIETRMRRIADLLSSAAESGYKVHVAAGDATGAISEFYITLEGSTAIVATGHRRSDGDLMIDSISVPSGVLTDGSTSIDLPDDKPIVSSIASEYFAMIRGFAGYFASVKASGYQLQFKGISGDLSHNRARAEFDWYATGIVADSLGNSHAWSQVVPILYRVSEGGGFYLNSGAKEVPIFNMEDVKARLNQALALVPLVIDPTTNTPILPVIKNVVFYGSANEMGVEILGYIDAEFQHGVKIFASLASDKLVLCGFYMPNNPAGSRLIEFAQLSVTPSAIQRGATSTRLIGVFLEVLSDALNSGLIASINAPDADERALTWDANQFPFVIETNNGKKFYITVSWKEASPESFVVSIEYRWKGQSRNYLPLNPADDPDGRWNERYETNRHYINSAGLYFDEWLNLFSTPPPSSLEYFLCFISEEEPPGYTRKNP